MLRLGVTVTINRRSEMERSHLGTGSILRALQAYSIASLVPLSPGMVEMLVIPALDQTPVVPP